MILKVAIPGRLQMRIVHRENRFFMQKKGDIHYIGGADILPAPLTAEEENAFVSVLGTDGDDEAKAILIEHNLRLVVYIAKKFDNTGVGVEDLISIGTIGLIKAINTFKCDKNIKLATYASRCIENEIRRPRRGARPRGRSGDLSTEGSRTRPKRNAPAKLQKVSLARAFRVITRQLLSTRYGVALRASTRFCRSE